MSGGAVAAGADAALAARVTKRFPDWTLDVELVLDRGVTALFGPSGAGKTSLLRCLAGLARPDAGRIARGDAVLFDAGAGIDVPPERRRVGVVFQDLRLFPHLDVARNLDYGRRFAPPGTAAPDRARVVELLELVPLLGRRPADLSGGEAQRVALGRALLAGPAVLLLDEPLSGLDEARRTTVLALLARVRDDLGVPMLLVSHSLSDILRLTTRVIVLEKGRVLGAGEIADVLGSEAVFRLADALGLESLLEVEVLHADPASGLVRGRLAGREIALPPTDLAPGSRALVAVRPEDVILARGPVEGISAQNALPGRVAAVQALPDRLLVTVDVGAPLRAEITIGSGRELGIEPGAAVWCLVKVFSLRWRGGAL